MATLTLDFSDDLYKVHDAEITGRKWKGYTAITITAFFNKMPRLTKCLKYIVSNADAGTAFTFTETSYTSATKTDAIPARATMTDAWINKFKDVVYNDVTSWAVSSGSVTFTKNS
jgi:hypothetical protein